MQAKSYPSPVTISEKMQVAVCGASSPLKYITSTKFNLKKPIATKLPSSVAPSCSR